MKYRLPAVALLACLAGTAVCAQDEISFKATEVAPGIHMLEGVGGFTGGNLGLITGDDGTVLIDAGLQPLFEKTYAAIRAQVGAGIEFLVNTHAHGDHVGGNARLSEAGATIVAHDKLRARLVANGVSVQGEQIEATAHWLPEITFSDSLTLHLNGHRIHVLHAAAAHTDGDAIVHFPDADVIHAGDTFFNGLYPYIDLDSGGSVDGYLAAQHRILMLAGDNTTIIPGHGPVATKDDLERAHAMLADARDRIRALAADGKSADDIVALNPLADYHEDWDWGFITTERMTRTLARDAAR